MNRRYLSLFLIFSISCYGSQESSCGTGPTPVPDATPTPVSTPKNPAEPTPTPNLCSFKTLTVKFLDGSQSLAKGERKQLDLTPFDEKGNEIAKGCNSARDPQWSVSDKDFCEVVGGGFNPQLLARSVTVEKCEVRATLFDEFQKVTIVSNSFRPEIR